MVRSGSLRVGRRPGPDLHARILGQFDMAFETECTSFERKLARVGWLIDELTRGRKRAIAAELGISRSTLARYTCTSAADWTESTGPVKLQTLDRILSHFDLRLEVVLTAAQEAQTTEELLYFARGSLQLLPPDRGANPSMRLVG